MDVSLLIAQVPVGQYVAWWKVIPLLILVLAWGRLITWIDKDAPAVLLPRVPINLGMISGGILALLLFFLIPNFWLAIAIVFLVVAAEAGTYLGIRSQKVGLGDLQTQFQDWLRGMGGKPKQAQAAPGEVQLLNKGGNPVPEPDAESPERPAYDAVQIVLTDPLRRDAERIELLAVDAAGYGTRYAVDGVTYAGTQIEKGRAAEGIQLLKRLAGMDLTERRKPQLGTMQALLDGKKRNLQIETAGSAAGEQLRVTVDAKKRHDLTLDQLGLTEAQATLVRESITNDNTGLVLVAAPRTQGLTTALYGILRAHDAFLTHIVTVEPSPDVDVEGITQNPLPTVPNAVEDARIVDWVISQQPDVLMAARVEDTKSANSLAGFAGDGHRVYVGLRAGSAFDALSQWRKLVGDDRVALRDLRYVVAGRVLRRLCPACKVGYAPDPTTLRKLNMDPTKVGSLYQARTEPLRDQKGNPIACDYCKELQYKGRIGIYEILVITDEVRQVLESGGTANQLKSVFRKQRGRYIQEQGLALVQAGETSVQEVLRVMKVGEPSASPGGAGPRAAMAPQRTPAT